MYCSHNTMFAGWVSIFGEWESKGCAGWVSIFGEWESKGCVGWVSTFGEWESKGCQNKVCLLCFHMQAFKLTCCTVYTLLVIDAFSFRLPRRQNEWLFCLIWAHCSQLSMTPPYWQSRSSASSWDGSLLHNVLKWPSATCCHWKKEVCLWKDNETGKFNKIWRQIWH